jgi:opacity protein-like surface antigen
VASKRSDKHVHQGLPLGALLLLTAKGIANDGSFGLRLAGGYGFSLNSTVPLTIPVKPQNSYAQSPGIPTVAEVLYSPEENFDISLGVFPVIMSRSYEAIFYDQASLQNINGNRTDTATFLPVMVSAYLGRDVLDKLNFFVGFGIGVVPAAQISSSDDQGQTIQPTNLDAGLALRGALGLGWAINSNVRLGLEAQAIEFSQHALSPAQGWSGSTQNFLQAAPLVFGEVRL